VPGIGLARVLDAVNLKKNVLQLSIADFKEVTKLRQTVTRRSHISSVGQCYFLSAIKIIDGRQKVFVGACQNPVRRDITKKLACVGAMWMPPPVPKAA